MTKVLLTGLLIGVSGCGLTEDDSLPPVERSQEIELGAMLPADAVLVGVAQTPAGRLFVLDQRSGLYEINDSRASLVYNTTGLNGVELTDVVALDDERLALTAENDGFLLDLSTQELTSYFCYLPPLPPDQTSGTGGGGSSSTPAPTSEPLVSVSQKLQLEGVAVKQRTESVAFNHATRQLFAQPRTFRLDTGDVAGSELFTFDESGGEPIRVQPFTNPDFVAGGMVTLGGDRLLVGEGRQLYEVTWASNLKHLRELDGSVEISGMAPCTNEPSVSGVFWVLDGAGRRLLQHHLTNL
jgi:hypothetical protein